VINVIILTSASRGSASVHLAELIKSKKINVKLVIISKGKITNKMSYYRRKLSKAINIGLFGVFNGIRMRKWYNNDTVEFMNLEPVESLCKRYKIPFKITPTINCSQTIKYFNNINADLGLSLGNGYIGSKIFSIPKFGMINIHHEELPAYQNAQSIIWQIYNNSPNTGYTIHKVDKNIDTGDILLKDKVPIIFKENLRKTVYYTYAKLWEKSSKGLVKLLENFEFYSNISYKQGSGSSYTTPSLFQFFKIVKNYRRLKILYGKN